MLLRLSTYTMMLIGPRFVLLVVITWIAFFGVPGRFRSHVLTVAGATFYTMWAPSTIWLVVVLVVLAYVLNGPLTKWIVVALLVGLLAYFKRPAGIMTGAGLAVTELRTGSPLILLGFSFLAFELIHYAIERSRGKINDASLVDLAAFAFFFPCRLAGPIKRYREFTSSVATAQPSAEDVYRGCVRILSGLLKKIALADTLGRVAPPIASVDTSLLAWASMLAYSLELYFDFSAYSDIAIGTSRVIGVRVPENFDWPYLSVNIQDFWNRWHMSLSSWARDYVFMGTGRELFKTRLRAHPGVIATASYMATFLVIGAWHGLTLNFLAWGAYNGLLVTLVHFYKMALPLRISTSSFYRSRAAACGSTVLTFLVVTIGWVFFRMDMAQADRVLRLMFHV